MIETIAQTETARCIYKAAQKNSGEDIGHLTCVHCGIDPKVRRPGMSLKSWKSDSDFNATSIGNGTADLYIRIVCRRASLKKCRDDHSSIFEEHRVARRRE